MKPTRPYLFISISSVALVVLLVIQVNWILETAKIKEEIFNEKANIVLARTADALSQDEQTCQAIEQCMDVSIVKKINRLFSYYMDLYNVELDYSFEIKTDQNHFPIVKSSPDQPGYYKKKLDEAVSKNGLELILIFPKKEEFILEEMGGMFITSVVLIIVVLVLFWRTLLSLIREKNISEHTKDFLNNMAHEFKTPLTNISLAGKMIHKDSTVQQEDKIKHYSGIILEENEKLHQQVEQVLNMTALERNEIPLQKTALDFHELLQSVLKNISLQIDSNQGQLQIKLDAENAVVMGDRRHLSSALCNLIDNAIKYSADKPELIIQTRNTDQQLIFSLSDNGIGIEKEYQKKVFDKFFRVPTGNVHDVKGFGLGLSYVKRIVELHEGKIELQSEKNHGTTFTIFLPYV